MNENGMKSKDATEARAGIINRANAAAAAGFAALSAPTFAVAANATETFDAVKGLISNGLGVIGGAMVVFGAVTVGLNVSGAAQGNGGAIGAGIATMVGGAVIAAAAIYFGGLSF